jgi:hypothetical protein
LPSAIVSAPSLWWPLPLHLFHSVRNCRVVRRKLECGGPDHPGPLRKHPVRPRNKPRPTLLCRWILRLRLPRTGGRPCLPFRVCAGERSGWPAHRLCRRSPPAVQGSGTWAGSGPSGVCSGVWNAAPSKANILTIKREDQAPPAVYGVQIGVTKTSVAAFSTWNTLRTTAGKYFARSLQNLDKSQKFEGTSGVVDGTF